MTTIEISAQDLATILAALRFYRQQGQGDPDRRSDDIHEIATDGGNVISLDVDGIDALCERINSGPRSSDPARDAAPLMLAALKEAQQWLVGVVDSGELLDEDRACLERIDAAIYKAEGGTNG